MKKFRRDIFLFLLPVAGIFVVLFIAPFSKHFAYHYLGNDCDNRAAWMDKKLSQPGDPLLVFFGSSHTITGIDDSLLTVLLDSSGQKTTALNFGYCRLGSNLQYSLVKDYLQTHHPKKIILEVREEESFGSHPVFPCLADAGDLFVQPHWANQHYVSDIYQSGIMRLNYYREQITGFAAAPTPVSQAGFGFRRSDAVADSAWMEKMKQERSVYRENKTLFRQTNIDWSISWIEQTAALAREHQCELIFLYLPSYGSNLSEPLQAKEYRRFGKVFLPEKSIFENPKNWRDDGHLNNSGATALTRWFYQTLQHP